MLINQRKKGEKKEKTDIWLFECVAANNLKQIVKRGTIKCLPHIAYMVQILIKGKQTFQCDLLRVGIIMIEKNCEVHQGTHVNGLNTRIHRNLFLWMRFAIILSEEKSTGNCNIPQARRRQFFYFMYPF